MTVKKYTAITLDTTVFDGNGLRLDKGLLASMVQFKTAPTTFVLTDVVVNEITSHIEERIKKSKLSLERSLDSIREHNIVESADVESLKNKLGSAKDCIELAKEKVSQFIESTGAIILDTNEYVTVKDLTTSYFSQEPPFAAVGEKQKEFPDAISLIALNNWAGKTGQVVYAISGDKDWASYCKSKELIDCYEDLSEALNHFNRAHKPYAVVSNLESRIASGNCLSFMTQLSGHLGYVFDGVDVIQEADSSFYWEPEGCEVQFINLNSIDDNLRVIRDTEDTIVIEATLNISLEINGMFSLSHFDSIDRDYVSMGSVERSVSKDFDINMLITLSGDFDEAKDNVDALEIDSVEMIDGLGSVYFGELEMDYEPDYE
ncbi:TPA: DUF4935 domain-containing protein [Klebsiella pneumoniae]|uniref:PIN domain-containing protein n=1 Tax=Klebsiella TaxID=570 RepID=UPI000A26DEF0|nr:MULTISPECIES: PIN domain-containing protein [Klebsiella]HDS5549420.1 DUF4935 domain-containing protein [Klebsiella aerogenes]EKX5120022.1 DUF4935 domain-containing protein [Klebsiella pneumoniae]MBW2952489.1 DUF4935 domain-containing protein [Klebsiella pneumoniae]MDS7621539.1 PIN domain-containing protein [Klebsiella pneumoniae]MDV0473936.1 PIN domain-containing protein [Klebsiella pneumoniae]